MTAKHPTLTVHAGGSPRKRKQSSGGPVVLTFTESEFLEFWEAFGGLWVEEATWRLMAAVVGGPSPALCAAVREAADRGGDRRRRRLR